MANRFMYDTNFPRLVSGCIRLRACFFVPDTKVPGWCALYGMRGYFLSIYPNEIQYIFVKASVWTPW